MCVTPTCFIGFQKFLFTIFKIFVVYSNLTENYSVLSSASRNLLTKIHLVVSHTLILIWQICFQFFRKASVVQNVSLRKGWKAWNRFVRSMLKFWNNQMCCYFTKECKQNLSILQEIYVQQRQYLKGIVHFLNTTFEKNVAKWEPVMPNTNLQM